MSSTTPYIDPQQIFDGAPLGREPGAGGGARLELLQLIEGCASRLKADLAAVIMQDARLRVRYANEKQASLPALALARELEADLQYWLKAAGNAVVRSKQRTSGRATRPSIPCKLIVAPILLTKGRADGILAVAKAPAGPNFTVREKGLLRSVAMSAASIVQAHFDAATGLMTRKELESMLDAALSAGSSVTTRHCVLHVDLDELQALEDSLGRQARDEVIRRVAERLEQQSKATGPVGRIGEDEFALLVRDCWLDRGLCIAQEIRQGVSSLSVMWLDQPVKVTASIGVTQLVPGVGTPESSLAAARIACVAAKELGKNQVKAFRHVDAVRLNDQRRVDVVARIQNALEHDRFVLYAQPIRPLSARKRTAHFEILLRGLEDGDELILPSRFIPYAEQSKIIPEIDRWVVEHSFQALSRCEALMRHRNAVFSINLSGQSLCEGGFLDFVIRQLERTNVPPSCVCFEVTETAAILNVARATQFMSALTKHGCVFSLDDFGAGLSSFSYLRRLPTHYLKIDGQFVRDIVDDPVCSVIVAAINQMGHAMGLETIAEFVENRAIKKHLREIGVDYVQGNGVAKPQPLADALSSLGRGRGETRARLVRNSRAAARPKSSIKAAARRAGRASSTRS